MKDEHKTKQQLIDELSGLRQRIDRLKTSEAQFMRAEEEMRKSYDTQRALNFLLSLSLEGTSLEEFLKRALRLILSIPWLAFESKGCIFLAEDDSDFLIMKAQRGLNESLKETCSRLPIGRCLCGRAAFTRQIQFADCLDDRHEVRYEGIVNHGHYSVPILFSDKLLGVINIYVKEGHPRNQREEAFLTSIANALSEAIKRRQAEEMLNARVQQQAIVAELGEKALTGLDLQDLMDETVVLVAKGLNVEYAKILELLPDEKALLLRAGVGWRKGLVGKAIVPADSDSQAGYTLLSSGPVIVDDLSTETRFKGPQLLIDHDVASGISVIIHDKDRHYGVMGAHTRKKRKFSEDDINFLQSVANIMTNVIDRRKAEGSAICTSGGRDERLQSSEKKLREITSALGEGVYVVNEHGRLIFMNPEAERLLGWKETELLDKNVHEIIHYCRPNGTPLSAGDCPVLKVIRTGEKYITEDDMFIRKDGTMFPVAYISTPMIEDGRIVGSITAFRDITLRKKMEDELINVKKLESIAFLAGGIAHDFNNLLTGILGNISLAKMSTSPDDKNFGLLTRAEKASFRAKDLTYQLLTFAKGGEPVKGVVYIKRLIEDTVTFSLSGSNVKCDFSIQEDLWPVEVDEGQLRQVIHNLSINAQRAMPEGGTLEVLAENVTVGSEDGLPVKEGRYVKISVKDHGIGIPKEHMKRIFDPYFTTKKMDSRKGTGLGLAVCYSIIKKHDGYITAESRVGIGTTFYIYIPASEKEIQAKEPKGEVFAGSGKVLVMDDEELIREVTCDMLRSMGYEVESAGDGQEAIELYKKARESGQPFGAVVMDLTVRGGMGGREAIKRLFEIDPDVKAIVSSGYPDDPIMSDFKKYGFRSVVAKPYKIQELSEILRKVLAGEIF
ncbi:MAG: GAF domain-containing protein [Nitrospirota bacterium]